MRFRLVYYNTRAPNCFETEERHEYLGDRDAVWYLWYLLTKVLGMPHVTVYNLAGEKQTPEEGIQSLLDSLP